MSSETSTIQLVCFDIGGVLIRIAETWTQACERAGIEPPAHVKGDGEADFAGIAHAYETGRANDQQFLEAITTVLAGISPDQARAIIHAWLIEPYPGVGEVMDLVNATIAVTACLSNTNLLHWRQMEEDARFAALLRRLDQHFTSFDIGARKPETEIFEQVEKVSALPAERILFFDDRRENIDAAGARGWHVQLIDPYGDPAEQMRASLVAHRVLPGNGDG